MVEADESNIDGSCSVDRINCSLVIPVKLNTYRISKIEWLAYIDAIVNHIIFA